MMKGNGKMIKWLSKQFIPDEDRMAVEVAFDKLWQTMANPTEMLLLARSEAGTKTLYIRVPDTIADRFPGFEEISAHEVPKEAELLVGHYGEFQKLFNLS
jgi:hypothetical protein